MTHPRFGKGSAGAQDSERRNDKAALAKGGRGGDKRMFDEQQAGTAASGRTGKLDRRGPGEKFGGGGAAVPGKRSSVGISAPAVPSRTGNVAGEAANKSRGPLRDKTRDYGK